MTLTVLMCLCAHRMYVALLDNLDFMLTTPWSSSAYREYVFFIGPSKFWLYINFFTSQFVFMAVSEEDMKELTNSFGL